MILDLRDELHQQVLEEALLYMKYMREPQYPEAKSALGALADVGRENARDQPTLLELAIQGLKWSVAITQPEWAENDRHQEGRAFYFGAHGGWGFDFVHSKRRGK